MKVLMKIQKYALIQLLDIAFKILVIDIKMTLLLILYY